MGDQESPPSEYITAPSRQLPCCTASRPTRLAESQMFRFRSGMGSKRLDKIGDYVRHGFDLQVFCKCGHKAKIDAAALADRLHKQGKSPIMMFVEAKLRCSKCGRKDVTCGPGWKET